MTAVKTEAAPYLEAFRPDPADPAWLAEMRRAALTKFGERGFPSRREEAWRFTNLRPLAETFFPPLRKPSPTAAVPAGIKGAHRIVIANGTVQSVSPDLPDGVWLSSMARAVKERPDLAERAVRDVDLGDGQPFASLNEALFADGFVLEVNDGMVVDRPIEIVHIADTASPASFHLRNLILVAPDSDVTVIESYYGTGVYWTNSVTRVEVLDGAVLTHLQVQSEARDAFHFNVVDAVLAPDATYRSVGLTLGAHLSRREMRAELGDGAKIDVAGAYLQRGDQDTTNAIVIDHAAPNATTHELFKGVLDERAHGAFLGTIRVREGAQKTDARQTSRALLLSDRAWVDTKPELEIFADDVKCAHGATVGDLDKETLFYLRARGIDADEARRMLIEAFVLEAIEMVEQPELRAHLAGHVRSWLEAAR